MASFIASYIGRQIAYFVKDFNKDNFNLALLKGEAELTEARMKHSLVISLSKDRRKEYLIQTIRETGTETESNTSGSPLSWSFSSYHLIPPSLPSPLSTL